VSVSVEGQVIEPKSEWSELSLLDIADIHNQARIPLSKMERSKKQGHFPYYGASGIIDHVDDYIFDGEFVLVSEDGENLKSRKTPIAFLAKGRFWVNNHAHILKGKKPFHNDLIIQYFRQLDLIPFVTGAVQPKLSKANLLAIPLFLPRDDEEQKAIAGVLSCLDDKIDLLHRQNQTLEALAETLFRQWFIEEAQDDWEKATVYKFASHSKENRKPQENPNLEYLHYSLPAFDAGMRSEKELGGNIKSNKYYVPPNSILISKLNPRVSRVWAVDGKVDKNAICSMEFQVAIPKTTDLYPFVYYLFRSTMMKNELEACASGTSGSHQRVKPEDIFEFTFSCPPEEKILKFSASYWPHLKKIFQNQEQIQTLENLRDTLLPKLMSGKVRVQFDAAAA
jgi:type I restriction enzyme, S subunit